MKYLVLIILSINTSLACQLSIPESYVETFLNPPVIGHYEKCEKGQAKKCFCVDAIDPWQAELVDNEVIDFVKKFNEVKCELKEIEASESDIKMFSYEDCDKKFEALECGKNEKIKNYDLGEVYCIKNIMKIDGKKLVNSPEKKKKHEEKLKAIEEKSIAKLEKKKKIKEIDIDKITTVKDLKAIVKDLVETME